MHAVSRTPQPSPLGPRSLAERLARGSPAACRVAAYGAAAAMGAPFFYHLARGSKAYLGLLEDDFFYYALVSDRLVTRGVPSFDGTTLTNGFHPLWLLVVLGVRAATGGLGPAFFGALALLFVASMIATYELSRRFARALGASAALAPALAVAPVFATNKLLATGMEVALAVPLYFWLLAEVARGAEVTPRRALKLGLLSSLAILARLDLAIAVAMLLAGWLALARPSPRKGGRALGAFALGGAPLAAYAVANVVVFGGLLPVSALAKQLRTRAGLNLGFLRSAALGTVYGAAASVVVVAGLVALVVLVRREARGQPAPGAGLGAPASRLAAGVALLFPVVFYGLNAVKSDWVFFPWYAYALAPAMVAGPALLCAWAAPLGRTAARASAAAVGAALLVATTPARAARHFVTHGPRWSLADNTLVAMAYELAARVRDRDGVFAMGAIAGIVGHALDRPVVQLEGLVGDRALLEHLRAEDPLDGVLAAHHVDYLVVTVLAGGLEARGGCYAVEEPDAAFAGESSAKLRMRWCAEPVVRFATPAGPNAWSRYAPLETFVFDVRGARARGAGP